MGAVGFTLDWREDREAQREATALYASITPFDPDLPADSRVEVIRLKAEFIFGPAAAANLATAAEAETVFGSTLSCVNDELDRESKDYLADIEPSEVDLVREWVGVASSITKRASVPANALEALTLAEKLNGEVSKARRWVKGTSLHHLALSDCDE